MFKQSTDDAHQYLTNATQFISGLYTQPVNTRIDALKRLKDLLTVHRPKTITDCIAWARQIFEELFHHRVVQLLYNCPLDMRTSNGTLFWSGSKKPPSIIQYDAADPLHNEFIVAVANMRAQMFQIAPCNDTAYMLAFAQNVAIAPFE